DPNFEHGVGILLLRCHEGQDNRAIAFHLALSGDNELAGLVGRIQSKTSEINPRVVFGLIPHLERHRDFLWIDHLRHSHSNESGIGQFIGVNWLGDAGVRQVKVRHGYVALARALTRSSICAFDRAASVQVQCGATRTEMKDEQQVEAICESARSTSPLHGHDASSQSHCGGGFTITGVVMMSIPSSANWVFAFSNVLSNGTATSSTERASESRSCWFLFSRWMVLVRLTRNCG